MSRPLRTRRRGTPIIRNGRRPAWAAPRPRAASPLTAACQAVMRAAVCARRAGQVIVACYVVTRAWTTGSALLPILITREEPRT